MNTEHRSRALIDALPLIVGILDAAATVRFANRHWRAYTGAADEDGLHGAHLLHHPDDTTMARALAAATPANRDVCGEVRIRRFDGVYRWHEVRIAPLADIVFGEPRWIYTAIDIEERHTALAAFADLNARLVANAVSDRATADALREKNRLMALAEETAHVGHWRLDLRSNALQWSDEVYRTYGFPTTYKPTLETALLPYHPDDRDRVAAIVAAAIDSGGPFGFESRVVRPDGTIRHVVSSGQSEAASDGKIIAIFGVFRDITDAKEAERERRRLIERVGLATRAAQVAIWEWDVSSRTMVWDPMMFALYGFDDAQFVPTYDRWIELMHPDDRLRVDAEAHEAAAGENAFDTTFRVVWRSGEVRYIRALATIMYDEAELAQRMIGTNWDVTELRVIGDQLRTEKDAATFAAAHDALTGLLNRRGLEAWIEGKHGAAATLLYLDIDGFKAVNDRGGHAAGDETLRHVAGIIRDAVRGDDGCARMGGDEFLIALPHARDDLAPIKISERIMHAVNGLCPLGPDDPTRIGISIGIGHLSSSAGLGEALREADADLYRQKAEHGRLAQTR